MCSFVSKCNWSVSEMAVCISCWVTRTALGTSISLYPGTHCVNVPRETGQCYHKMPVWKLHTYNCHCSCSNTGYSHTDWQAVSADSAGQHIVSPLALSCSTNPDLLFIYTNFKKYIYTYINTYIFLDKYLKTTGQDSGNQWKTP